MEHVWKIKILEIFLLAHCNNLTASAKMARG
jgi:hypothetical protein